MATRRELLFGCCAWLILPACVTPCLAQIKDSPDDLAKTLSLRVPTGRVDGNFVECLGQIARAFNVPMGIAWLKTPSTQQFRSIKYSDITLLEIINTIASTEPNYEVSVGHGLVHINTKEIPWGQNFLHQKIKEFSQRGVPNSIKWTLWMQLNQMVSPDPSRGYGARILSSPADPILDLRFTNATVEEILDSVAAASGNKVWVATFEDDLALTPGGFRRTEWLTSRESVPNEGQPVWDSLPWDSWKIQLKPTSRPEAPE